MEYLEPLFRWIHVIAGVLWIGLLWFFNFVNIPFAAKMKEAGAAGTVVPELMPRALFWFRWGAAWTWVTGVLLLLLVFYHGGALLDGEGELLTTANLVMLGVTFLGVFIYDAWFKSPAAGNLRVAYSVGFVFTAVVAYLMTEWAGYGYRGMSIHIGSMFGTAMAFNVWFRIWPAQQQIIAAVKAGEAPDAALPALAGSRSRHNTYMSVPLLWTMINTHTGAFSGAGVVGLLVIILVGWHLVFQLYARSAKVEGA